MSLLTAILLGVLAASKLLVSACVARAGGSVTILDADAIPVGNLTAMVAPAEFDVASMVYFQHGRGQSYSPAQVRGQAARALGTLPYNPCPSLLLGFIKGRGSQGAEGAPSPRAG
jgi:hypothetical protein